jgi:hypothetical protein
LSNVGIPITDRMSENGNTTTEIDPTPRSELQGVLVGPEPTHGDSTALSEDPPRPGRPTKYCPEVVKIICEAISDGVPHKHAASLAGISVDTFCEWKKRFPEFSEAVQEAIASGIHQRLKLVKGAAECGDVKAAQWWLEHVVPEHFARNRIEHAGQVGLSVEPKMDEQTLQRLRHAYRLRFRAEVAEELREEMRKSNTLTSGSGAVIQ